MSEKVISIDKLNTYQRLCGYQDRNVRLIAELAGSEIIPRGNTLIISGDEPTVQQASDLISSMLEYLNVAPDGYEFSELDIRYFEHARANKLPFDSDALSKVKINLPGGKMVIPRTLNQIKYIEAIFKNPVTFGIGPAGTGKTFLAVSAALKFYNSGDVERIILTRPAVEAGESLGFLPGDFIAKINPYLRPLYDALFELYGFERIQALIEKGNIEIAPLAYMRGRTLNNAFIILDEAQNTTSAQMKMFLTRLGNNSKIVISGDYTQIDLAKPSQSGLLHAMKILQGIKEISFIEFGRKDICRHPVVEKIVAAYEKNQTSHPKNGD